MDAERWKSIESLYHEALAMEPVRRSSFLAAACAQDPEAKREIESLIGYIDEADRVFEGQRPAAFHNDEVLNRRFRIVRRIGTGGMGEVYEAEDLVLRESVALKTIRPDLVDQELMRARLLREVHSAQRIAHPNICQIHDVHLLEVDGENAPLFLTMELLRGETLASRLGRNGRMAPTEAARVAEQLAGALTAAHHAQVIHRDFKTENIILEPDDRGGTRAVVTDFGIARIESEITNTPRLTRTGQIVGTLAYMAPEQLLGRPVTTAVDIYAFGVVLFEMVTGAQPFAGGSRLALAAKRLAEPAPSPRTIAADLPTAWERTIARCLEREPQNRFREAADVWRSIAG